MGKALKDFGRKGTWIGAVMSSDGVTSYSIFSSNDQLSCSCIGYKVRQTCRHLQEYAASVGKMVCPVEYCHRICPEEDIRSYGICIRCEDRKDDV